MGLYHYMVSSELSVRYQMYSVPGLIESPCAPVKIVQVASYAELTAASRGLEAPFRPTGGGHLLSESRFFLSPLVHMRSSSQTLSDRVRNRTSSPFLFDSILVGARIAPNRRDQGKWLSGDVAGLHARD